MSYERACTGILQESFKRQHPLKQPQQSPARARSRSEPIFSCLASHKSVSEGCLLTRVPLRSASQKVFHKSVPEECFQNCLRRLSQKSVLTRMSHKFVLSLDKSILTKVPWHKCPAKVFIQTWLTRLSHKACLQRASRKSISEKCLDKSAPEECLHGVSYRSAQTECPTDRRAASKSVLHGCLSPTKAPRPEGIWSSSWCALGFVGSIGLILLKRKLAAILIYMQAGC